MPEPRASIIIVTYGQRALTELCLRSLETCLGDRLGTEFELVLVDNNSPDDTAELLRSWSDRAIVRLLDENRNFSGGNNVGAAEARGDVLVFLNNDTEVTPGALEILVEQALEPGVSIAGCRLLFPDGTLQHAGVAFLNGKGLDHAAMPQHIFHRQDQSLPAARGSFELDSVTAACFAVRTTDFRAAGGFDEGYRNGLEDIDLCLRIKLTGTGVVYRGDATVIHHEGASRGQGAALWATPEKLAAARANDLLFVGRWAHQLDQDNELALRLFDASLEDHAPARLAATAEVVVHGQPSGIGPAADEARAFLALFAAAGILPAAVDEPHPNVIARLTGAAAELLDGARRRFPVHDSHWVVVPSGLHDPCQSPVPPIVRLARPQTAVPLSLATAVWATCPRVAEALIDDGFPQSKIVILPPPVPSLPLGPGGGGVLAILPAHDPAQARMVLQALRQQPRGTEIRLLPTVFTRNLDRDVADALPGAELLGPCSDEARFAALAATADVVVAVDADDPFERRALVAAGVGAAIITADDGGPAAAVLGDVAAGEPGTLASRLSELLAQPGDRGQRAATVAQACDPGLVAAHLPQALAAAA